MDSCFRKFYPITRLHFLFLLLDGSKSSAASQSEEEGMHLKENSAIRVILCPIHLMVSSSMVQRVHKFIHCTGDHEYEPYSKPVKGKYNRFISMVVFFQRGDSNGLDGSLFCNHTHHSLFQGS